MVYERKGPTIPYPYPHRVGSARLESLPWDKTITRTYLKVATIMNRRHNNIMLRYVSPFRQCGDKGMEQR